MRRVCLLLATLWAGGCIHMGGSTESGHGGSVRLIDHGFLTPHFTELEYWSSSALAARNEYPGSTAEDREGAYSGIPACGALRVSFVRRDLDHANPKYYRVVVRDAEREIARAYGEHEVPRWDGGVWKGFMVIPLPNDTPERFLVHVIDPECRERNVYEVTTH